MSNKAQNPNFKKMIMLSSRPKRRGPFFQVKYLLLQGNIQTRITPARHSRLDRESTHSWILGSRLRLMLRRGEVRPRMTNERDLSLHCASSKRSKRLIQRLFTWLHASSEADVVLVDIRKVVG